MITKDEIIRGCKAVIDDYKDEDWYKERKPRWYGVLKKPTKFREGCNDGCWALTVSKGKRLLEWVNRGSNEWKDWLYNLDAIPVTTKVNTKIKVCKGWKIAYKQYKPYLFEVIKQTKPTHINFYSHSKGCPITAYAVENIGFYKPKIKLKSIYFSAPRPGNKEFIESHDSKCESIMVFLVGDLVCCLPPWMKQIKNVKGYWRFPPMLPWTHYPDNVLKSIEEDHA